MTTDGIGLYVHVPFCVAKCNYCDFTSFACVSAAMRADYIRCICEEIRSYKREPKITVSTIFFGGGTPSLLTDSEFEAIVDAINDAFVLPAGVEFTVEANPKTLDYNKIRMMIGCGVNRISIGVQSFVENELHALGRIHSVWDSVETVKMVRSAGIKNVSIDLMYGIPKQTVESFNATLNVVLTLELEHISCYGLIIEEGTPFYRMRKEQAREYLPSDRQERILPAVERMERSFADRDVTVESLSEMCGMSEVYFRKIFFCKFGMSPKEYLIQKRMEYAKQLLTSGQFEVSDVAELCGYSEPCHFSREFKKRVGVSPKEYRE